MHRHLDNTLGQHHVIHPYNLTEHSLAVSIIHHFWSLNETRDQPRMLQVVLLTLNCNTSNKYSLSIHYVIFKCTLYPISFLPTRSILLSREIISLIKQTL